MKVKVKNNAGYLVKKYVKEFRFMRAKALQATANEIFKYTLPNNPNSKGTEKQVAKGWDYNKQSASKLGGAMVRNLRFLQKRTKRDILGDNLPQAFPTPKQNKIVKGSLIGDFPRLGFVILRTKKKRKNKKKILPPQNLTNDPQVLIEHIKATTRLKGGNKTAKRIVVRRGKLLWIKTAKVAKQAAAHFIFNAGHLLSGWRTLQDKILTLKKDAMGSNIDLLGQVLAKVGTKQGRKGQATIRENEDLTAIRATNTNVAKAVKGYQQRMIEQVTKQNLKKHVENEMFYLKKKIEKEIKQRIKENYKKA